MTATQRREMVVQPSAPSNLGIRAAAHRAYAPPSAETGLFEGQKPATIITQHQEMDALPPATSKWAIFALVSQVPVERYAAMESPRALNNAMTAVHLREMGAEPRAALKLDGRVPELRASAPIRAETERSTPVSNAMTET